MLDVLSSLCACWKITKRFILKGLCSLSIICSQPASSRALWANREDAIGEQERLISKNHVNF